MTSKQIREIAETMRDCGITHIKTSTLEMTCQPPVLVAQEPVLESIPPIVSALVPATPTALSDTKDKDIIEHKIETLASLMKLSDVELVDSLFPDHTQETDEEDVA